MGDLDFVITVVSAGLLVVAQILLNPDDGKKKKNSSLSQSAPVPGSLERRLGMTVRGLAIAGVVCVLVMFVWHVAHR